MNVKPLNTIPLNGEVIIKKGGGDAPPSGSTGHADADIVAALTNHPNVSLASA